MSLKVKIGLNENQLRKINSAYKKKGDVAIILKNDQLLLDKGGVEIDVKPEQYKKILSAKNSKAKRGLKINLSSDLKHNQAGGFIFSMVGLISAITSAAVASAPAVAAGSATAVGAYTTKKALEAIGGEGLTLPGSGLTLPGTKRRGAGIKLVGTGKPKPKKKK